MQILTKVALYDQTLSPCVSDVWTLGELPYESQSRLDCAEVLERLQKDQMLCPFWCRDVCPVARLSILGLFLIDLLLGSY